ncbi:MAG: imidazole glycerol phosphate synthase subunit HisH [Candidatus Gastranaerophilales bacterium]|nr:imidazole glycerol phosphate synthase subunit HisH [Candidatus Gastranaerophilales bacterium]
MKNKIVIIDYNSGNIKSLGNMLSYLGCEYILSNKKEDILSAKKLLFPGQGHFAQAMDNLERSGLIDTIKTSINSGIDFLGICLGLQILFEKSEEAPNIEGLGIIKGEVKKFKTGKIPQVGWNKIQTTTNNSYLSDDYFYFVNSYYVEPLDKTIVSSKTNYEIEFCSSIQKDNLCAVQFHPEKSSNAGINFFKKWLEL